MADFIHQEGFGSLFKNEKAEGKQPNMKGTFVAPCDMKKGQTMEIAAWTKEGSKGRFLSLKIQSKKDAPTANSPAGYAANTRSQFADMDDDVPF